MAQTKIKRKQFFDDGWIPADETWTYASADDPTYTFTIATFDAPYILKDGGGDAYTDILECLDTETTQPAEEECLAREAEADNEYEL